RSGERRLRRSGPCGPGALRDAWQTRRVRFAAGRRNPDPRGGGRMDDDPHIHVQAKVMQDDAAVRNMLASTFGLAGGLPSHVGTGCGLRAPAAMTSAEPESVTCLACREHAQAEHLRLAEQVERLS